MTSIPLPFLTVILLLILAGANHRQLQQTPTGRVIALFLYVNVVAMLCIGFRWSFGFIALLPVAVALAMVGSALLYLAFCSLGRQGPVIQFSRDWPHLIPLALLALVLIIEPRWTDFLLVLTKLVYAALLIRLAQRAPKSLQLVRLHWFSNAHQALLGAVTLLLFSAVVDIAIAVDFALYEGRHAARVVGVANLVTICLLGWASIMAGRGMSPVVQPSTSTNTNALIDAQSDDDIDDEANEPVDETNEEYQQLLLKLNHLLIDQRLYADTELNLQKLARKVGVPARAVSRAINNQTGKNVSQWVNAARIDAACDLLGDNSVSVTHAMNEVGFMTKSNFNREFRRAKGCSPSQWRAEH